MNDNIDNSDDFSGSNTGKIDNKYEKDINNEDGSNDKSGINEDNKNRINNKNNKIVLDSSAILTLLEMKQGHEIITERLDQAIVSSISFSEVVADLAKKGFGQDEVIHSLKETFFNIEKFDTNQAFIAAKLDEFTKKYNLSFEDRACLALAKANNLTVLTADKTWKEMEGELGIEIRLVVVDAI